MHSFLFLNNERDTSRHVWTLFHSIDKNYFYVPLSKERQNLIIDEYFRTASVECNLLLSLSTASEIRNE